MEIKNVYIGGWFQRTTLHLTEIWVACHERRTDIEIDKEKLRQLVDALEISHASRETEYLERITVKTPVLLYRIYEDGLIVVEKQVSDLQKDLAYLKMYYDEKLSPFISYLFSKGAPIPKEFADIKTILPYIVITKGAKEEVYAMLKELNEQVYNEAEHDGIGVYWSPRIIVVNNCDDPNIVLGIAESHIFFREFKAQLHRYLQLHRMLWERIAAIKEKGGIKGTEIVRYRNELSQHQKTIDLIDARIKQMGSYMKTRQKITDVQKVSEYLHRFFQYRFEALQDTHEYIRYLWDMTRNYVNSAVALFVELEQKSTKTTISSLQVITAMGVVAAILGYIGRKEFPQFTSIGLFYFLLLIGLTWFFNWSVSKIYQNKKYPLRRDTGKVTIEREVRP